MKIAIKLSHCVIKSIKVADIVKKSTICQEKIAIFTAIFYLTKCRKPYIIKGKSVKIAMEMQASCNRYIKGNCLPKSDKS